MSSVCYNYSILVVYVSILLRVFKVWVKYLLLSSVSLSMSC
jgi:hypothetical protein